jgi:aminoglycoside phosphotransferase (APT) family kinase protein
VLISASFPSVDSDGLTHVGSGWDFDAFLTRDGWVFRFPRRAEAAATLETERRVHGLVAAALPGTVRVPQAELVSAPSEIFPLVFAGHRFVNGTRADSLGPSLLSNTARSLAEALGAIHAIPEERVRDAGIREMELELPGDWLECASAAAELLGPDPVLTRAVDWLAKQIRFQPALRPPSLSLIHDDLHPEHMLADASTGELIGLLDWSDAGLGDPTRDFVQLVAWGGWSFAREVFAHYAGRSDPTFWKRLEFIARLRSVMWLGIAYQESSDVAEHARWVRNVFAGA